MNHVVLSILASSLALLAIGCGTAPSPTPLPTQPPLVITVIVTATPPPPTATSAAPTVTPMPTLPLTATVTTATPTPAVAKATTPPRSAATRTPTRPLTPSTATALPIKFAAPSLNRPIWTENQKDEAKFPGSAIVLDWKSVGGLAGDECYLVRLVTEPVNPSPGIGVKSDYWVVGCGDQTPLGASVKFTLESPNRPGPAPHYGSILLDTSEMWVNWSVTVVKNLGGCEPGYLYHCKTAPISPPGQGRFLLKGG